LKGEKEEEEWIKSVSQGRREGRKVIGGPFERIRVVMRDTNHALIEIK